MNFEELYQKYKAGTATPEEQEAVKQEIEKAKRISSLLDGEFAGDIDPLSPADKTAVQKAKKAFNLRNTLKTFLIAVISITVVGSLVCGGIFATAFFSANNAKTVTADQAIDSAKELLAQHLGIGETVEMIVNDTEEELDIGSKLTDSVYLYEIQLIYGDYSYEIQVSSKTGYALLRDKEALKSQNKNQEKTQKYYVTH